MIGRLLCWMGLHDYPLEVRGADGWLIHCARPDCGAYKSSGGASVQPEEPPGDFDAPQQVGDT